jgi:hypothetical protein
MRAIKAPKSRHAAFRFRFNHAKASLVQDTFPRVMELCFPGVSYRLDRSDWFAEYPNGAQVWFGGLDDKERTEKVLGQEFATIFLNEISQIPFASRGMAVTRLAQKVDQVIGESPQRLIPRMYYDLNPTTRAHWGYRIFHEHRDPETRLPLADAEAYAYCRLNPEDNAQNLSDEYLGTLRSLSQRQQKRFLRGEWADATPNALFSDETLDAWRVMDGRVPEMVRVVVAVDPSGSGDADNADNDAIGIVVAGIGVDGNAYVMEDCTVKAGPATWGRVATSAYDRHDADCVVGEANYGGEMVRTTILAARARTPYKRVIATRGKHVRAEPIAALYEQGKVRHVGFMRELEDELVAFSTLGYTGTGSPNRADALIWALSELFPAIVADKRPSAAKARVQPVAAHSWMG